MEHLSDEQPVTFRRFAQVADAPPSTATRLLERLASASLVVKARRDEYLIPDPARRVLIMSEPSPYIRSVLAWKGVERRLGKGALAFACLPVRAALGVAIPEALPVLPLPGPSEGNLGEGRFPQITRMEVRGGRTKLLSLRSPSSAPPGSEAFEVQVRGLMPGEALALLAATADPRILRELPAACQRLRIPQASVIERAGELSIALSPTRGLRSNSVILGTWLRAFATTGRAVQAKAAIDRLASPPDGGGRGGSRRA